MSFTRYLKRSTVIHLVFFALMMAVLSNCTGNLSAEVFLDKNGDNKLADSDPVIANLQATLYRDGEEVERTVTDHEGKVNFVINQKGRYCVRVDEIDLYSSPVGGLSPTLLQSIDSDPEKPFKGLGTSEDNSAEPIASAAPTPEATPQAPVSPQSKNTTKPLEACADSTGLGSISLKVPIPIDYEKAVASISEPLVHPVSPGDEVDLVISYPKSCKFKLLALPEAVGIPTGADEDMLHEVNLNEAGYIEQSGEPKSSPAINRDAQGQFLLKVKLKESIEDSENGLRFEITPQVLCPGDRELNLRTHVLEIKKQTMFEVYHDREGHAEPGGEVTIITHVINHSHRDFSANDVRLIFSGPEFGDATFDVRCGGSRCGFPILAQEQVDIRTRIKIPSQVGENTNFQLSTQLKVTVDGREMVFAEEAPAKFGVMAN